MKIKQSPKKPPEVRKKQLLKAAEVLFNKKGYTLTTIELIAKKAGLTKGAFYHHFKNKEDIVYELIKQILDSYLTGLRAIKGKRLAPVDFLRILHEVDQSGKISSIQNNLDVRAQIYRIPKVKDYVNKSFKNAFKIFVKHLDPQYAQNENKRHQLAILTLCYYEGLHLRSTTLDGMIDIQKQLNVFESLFEKK